MSDYKHIWADKDSRYVVLREATAWFEKPQAPAEFKSKDRAEQFCNAYEGAELIARYTDQQMELEALNEGWVLWTATESSNSPVDEDVFVEVVSLYMRNNGTSGGFGWSSNGSNKCEIIAYRLSNAEGYKDGVKVERFKTISCSYCSHDWKAASNNTDMPCPNCKEIEDMKSDSKEWVNGLPPVGEVCEAMWLEAPDGGSREWCKVTYKRDFDSKVWFRHGDDEIILHTFHVEFRPIQSERDKTVTAAITGDTLAYCGANIDTYRSWAEDLFDRGMLSMPKGDK